MKENGTDATDAAAILNHVIKSMGESHYDLLNRHAALAAHCQEIEKEVRRLRDQNAQLQRYDDLDKELGHTMERQLVMDTVRDSARVGESVFSFLSRYVAKSLELAEQRAKR